MANTFTGLKLQGQIGKFGAKELSDIEGQRWCADKYIKLLTNFQKKKNGCMELFKLKDANGLSMWFKLLST